jgi:hypothetical protein
LKTVSAILNPQFPMKGPYERLKYDLRRLWECPVCKRRERTDGTVTFRFCPCGTKKEGGQPVVMQLIADGPQRLVPPIAAAQGQCAEAAATSDDTLTRSVSEGDLAHPALDRSESAESTADTGTMLGPS